MKAERNFEFGEEAARQFALERYDILDTAEEYCFDHITQSVKLALDVPMAAISLMDGERLWFKSKIGFDVSEVPRYTAFCNYTIGQNSSTVVEDTTLDPRFKYGTSVQSVLSLKSYIGVPLTTPDGHNIGTLCAGDIVPRRFGHSKIELMEQLAELVIHELELRQQSEKDGLTGALTRSGFSAEVQKAIALYDRQKILSTLILFDVDRYIMATDRSDCRSGNKLLRAVIQSLTKRLRPSDCIGRIGGTQFAILLSVTTGSEAMLACEQFLKSIEGFDAGSILDLKFSQISPKIGICDDWIDQANLDHGPESRSGCSDIYLKSGRRFDSFR
ncbi:MAG: diguanylate cyclase [Parasphingorhabdus sp.]